MASGNYGFEGEVVLKLHKQEKAINRIESLIVRPTLSGAVFPTTPPANTVFYRTDLGMLFYYTGSEWRSHEQPVFLSGTGSVDAILNAVPMRQDMEYVVTKLVFRTYPISPNDNTNHWHISVRGYNLATSSSTTHYTFSTQADTDDAWTAREVAPSTASPGANDYWLALYADEDSSPGNVIVAVTVYFYWIAT